MVEVGYRDAPASKYAVFNVMAILFRKAKHYCIIFYYNFNENVIFGPKCRLVGWSIGFSFDCSRRHRRSVIVSLKGLPQIYTSKVF